MSHGFRNALTGDDPRKNHLFCTPMQPRPFDHSYYSSQKAHAYPFENRSRFPYYNSGMIAEKGQNPPSYPSMYHPTEGYNMRPNTVHRPFGYPPSASGHHCFQPGNMCRGTPNSSGSFLSHYPSYAHRSPAPHQKETDNPHQSLNYDKHLYPRLPNCFDHARPSYSSFPNDRIFHYSYSGHDYTNPYFRQYPSFSQPHYDAYGNTPNSEWFPRFSPQPPYYSNSPPKNDRRPLSLDSSRVSSSPGQKDQPLNKRLPLDDNVREKHWPPAHSASIEQPNHAPMSKCFETEDPDSRVLHEFSSIVSSQFLELTPSGSNGIKPFLPYGHVLKSDYNSLLKLSVDPRNQNLIFEPQLNRFLREMHEYLSHCDEDFVFQARVTSRWTESTSSSNKGIAELLQDYSELTSQAISKLKSASVLLSSLQHPMSSAL